MQQPQVEVEGRFVVGFTSGYVNQTRYGLSRMGVVKTSEIVISFFFFFVSVQC